MICPKCQNEILISEFSCSKCGLKLPVKNQQERILAEKYAAQIYAEKRAEAAKKAETSATTSETRGRLDTVKAAVKKGYSSASHAVEPGKKIATESILKAKDTVLNKVKTDTQPTQPEKASTTDIQKKKNPVKSLVKKASVVRNKKTVTEPVRENYVPDEIIRHETLSQVPQENPNRFSNLFRNKDMRLILLLVGIMLVCFIFLLVLDALRDNPDTSQDSVAQTEAESDSITQTDRTDASTAGTVIIVVPESSSSYIGRNHNDVRQSLLNAGFLEITEVAVDDLVWRDTEDMTKQATVKDITIDGNAYFDTGSSYSPDAEVIISYHVLPDRDYYKSYNLERNPTGDSLESDDEDEIFVQEILFPVLDGYTLLQSLFFWIEEDFTYEYIESVARKAGFYTIDNSDSLGKSFDISETKTLGFGPGNEPYYIYDSDHIGVSFYSSGKLMYKGYTFQNKYIRVDKYSYDYAGPGHSIIIRAEIPESYEKGLDADIKDYTDLKEAMDFVISQ